jgi:hypothetical protein
MLETRVLSGSTNQYHEIAGQIEYLTDQGYRVVALSQSQHGFLTVWICVLEKDDA